MAWSLKTISPKCKELLWDGKPVGYVDRQWCSYRYYWCASIDREHFPNRSDLPAPFTAYTLDAEDMAEMRAKLGAHLRSR